MCEISNIDLQHISWTPSEASRIMHYWPAAAATNRLIVTTKTATSRNKLQSTRILTALVVLLLISSTQLGAVVKCDDERDGQQSLANKLGPLWLYRATIERQTTSSNNSADQPAPERGDPRFGSTQISDKLIELLTKRVGPNTRASSDYHDFQDVHLNESIEAWTLMRKQVAAFAHDQVHLYGPQLRHLLTSANVSLQCLSASEQFIASIEQLDSWAVQMWSSSGNFPPVGLFDGHFTDLGSYRGCVDIKRTINSTTTQEMGTSVAQYVASYCMVGFRPVVPSRRRFHQIFTEESPSLAKQFAQRDTFNRIAHWAQYFHYVYMKTGICVPAECSPSDIQQVTRLIGRKFALITAPVRCFTRAPGSKSLSISSSAQEANQRQLAISSQIDNKPVLVNVNKVLNSKQLISLAIVGAFFAIVFAATAWHGCELAREFMLSTTNGNASHEDDYDDDNDNEQGNKQDKKAHYERSNSSGNGNIDTNLASLTKIELMQQSLSQYEANKQTNNKMTTTTTTTWHCYSEQVKWVAFHYLSMITNGREFMVTSMRSNEIKCLHGFRVFTMIWIICVHTLQYNDWSGFSRAFENVASLQNPIVHPLINANYVVDNFFLMSGLLAAYTIWYNNKGGSSDFSPIQCLIGRYLRLTPQVLLISLLYILLPLVSDGPFWYDVTNTAALECEQNWWINLLHVQSFYKKDQMCNLVGWWISVDMFYYVLALGLVWLILNKQLRKALACTILLVTYCILITAWRHYSGGFEPNNIATVPQIGEVWSEFVVEFYWSPYPHAFVFYLGLWLGYVIANKLCYHQVRRWSRMGWLVSIASLLGVNYSSRLWTTGTLELNTDHQVLSTGYNIACAFIWACAFGWTIVASHYGCAPALNRFCSSKINIMISKASFIIYLSHMLLLRAYFGSQYNLIEVSTTTILMMLISLNVLSIGFGVFLCIAFEGPCLKFQRLILKQIKRERFLPIAGASYSNGLANVTTPHEDKNSLNLGPTSIKLLK